MLLLLKIKAQTEPPFSLKGKLERNKKPKSNASVSVVGLCPGYICVTLAFL